VIDDHPLPSEGRRDARRGYDRRNIEDDIKTGRPKRYFDYIYETYGTIFQTASIQALGTFRELVRQILALGSKRTSCEHLRLFNICNVAAWEMFLRLILP
jgi:hypothetical protein